MTGAQIDIDEDDSGRVAVFATSRDKIAIDVFMKEPIEAVKRFAISKMELLGSVNRV